MNVYFKPWVGPNYETSERKILVIGDSHYCKDNDCGQCGVRGNCSMEEMSACRDFTINAVKNYLTFRAGGKKGNWMTKTYLPFDKIFIGKEDVSSEESLAMWNNIAFHNFVQTAISLGASNKNYTNEDYAASSPMATEVINTLRPDVVIVWGGRAWGALTDEGWHSGENDYSGYYTWADGHKVNCIKIVHPSRAGFEEWHEKLRNFLTSLK